MTYIMPDMIEKNLKYVIHKISDDNPLTVKATVLENDGSFTDSTYTIVKRLRPKDSKAVISWKRDEGKWKSFPISTLREKTGSASLVVTDEGKIKISF